MMRNGSSPPARALPLSMVITALAALSGCASNPASTAAGGAKVGLKPTEVGNALAAPLDDLNLRRAPIPSVLLAAQQAPYGAPSSALSQDSTPSPAVSCGPLVGEIQALDAALGPDLDAVVAVPSKPNLLEEGADAVNDAAVGAVRGAAQGLLPFRIWLRRLSGAHRHESDTNAARMAGGLRRAFLKGIARERGCLGKPQVQLEPPPDAKPTHR
jgi:hypothetical protein